MIAVSAELMSLLLTMCCCLLLPDGGAQIKWMKHLWTNINIVKAVTTAAASFSLKDNLFTMDVEAGRCYVYCTLDFEKDGEHVGYKPHPHLISVHKPMVKHLFFASHTTLLTHWFALMQDIVCVDKL